MEKGKSVYPSPSKRGVIVIEMYRNGQRVSDTINRGNK